MLQSPNAFLFSVFLACVLAACGSTPSQPNAQKGDTKTLTTETESEENIAPPPQYTFVDSTRFFDDNASSISLRATFNPSPSTQLVRGYQLQFRTISRAPKFLSSISVVANGERFFVEENQVVLPAGQALIFNLSIEDSEKIASDSVALLQFKYNEESILYRIKLHQLQEFSLE